MSTVLMLLLLAGSFALFRGLVRFCENLIGPAPGTHSAGGQHDGRAAAPQKAVKHSPSGSSG